MNFCSYPSSMVHANQELKGHDLIPTFGFPYSPFKLQGWGLQSCFLIVLLDPSLVDTIMSGLFVLGTKNLFFAYELTNFIFYMLIQL